MDDSVLGFVKDYIWGPVMGAAAWGWTVTHKRIDSAKSHADANHRDLKAYIDKEVVGLTMEVGRQRDVSAKIFDKLEDMGKRSEDRHLELLNTLHSGLAGKADK